jgi:hypothetical protein
MFVFANAGPVRVVVELDEVVAPPEEHGMAGRKHGVDDDQQGAGPLADGADRGVTPVEGACQAGHFPRAADLMSGD